MMTRILTGEAAGILGVSSEHVRYLERAGRLHAQRIGRLRTFERAEVEQLAAERVREANNPRLRGKSEA
jgi:excisionase family DNA binding protein